MNERDFDQFRDAWITGHEVSGSNRMPSENAINLAFDLLAEYPFEHVLSALQVHSSRSDYKPTPSAILAILNTGNRRLSADEAWAICPKSEAETVVWTAEMASAYAVASELLDEGDRIGARMAFKGAYERLCNESEMMNKPVKWSVSLGHDQKGRDSVIQDAVVKGRLTQQVASKYLGLNHHDAGPIAGLLTGKVVLHPKANKIPIAKLKEIKKIIDNAHDVRMARREAVAREQAERQKAFELERDKALQFLNEKINEKETGEV